MKNPLALATLFCALTLTFTTAAQAATLKVASTPTGSPFTFLNTKTNSVEGVMVDIVNAVSSPEIGLHLFQSQNARCTALGVLYFKDRCGRSML